MQHTGSRIQLAMFVLVVILVPSGFGLQSRGNDSGFGVALSPSSIVLKVGEKAGINVTVTHPEKVNSTQVCFTLEGFPSSGFRTSFNPVCSNSHDGGFDSVLTIEVTPASAPQTVQGIVIASSAGQSATAVLNLTVEPAMSPWIPWLGLILFFSVLTLAIVWKPKLPGRKSRRRSKRTEKV